MKNIFVKLNYIFSKKDKIKLVIIMILIIIGSFTELAGVSIFMPFISVMTSPDEYLSNPDNGIAVWLYQHLNVDVTSFLTLLAICIAAIYIIKNVYLTFMQNCILSFTYKTRMKIATKLLNTYMHEPYTFHLERNIAELQRSLSTDTQQFMLLINNMLETIAEITVIIAIGAYLLMTSPIITVFVLSLLVICMLIFMIISKKVSLKLGKQNEYYMAKMNQWVNQALGGIKEVKVLHREQYFVNSYQNNYKKEIVGAKSNEMLATIPKYVTETACMVGASLAIAFKLHYSGSASVASLVPQLSAFAIAAMRLLPSVGKINAYVTSINYCMPSLDNVYYDLKSTEDIDNRDDQPDLENNAKFISSISLDNITYRYPNTERNIIDHVNLIIPKGKTYALIGESGAGKTTLADIILGLLDPQTGCVKVDDWKIKDNPHAWHKLLGYIPQNIYLTDDTIRNNIAFGLNENDVDEQAVIDSICKVHLDQFIAELPDGINTMVGDRGVRISGGQRQRIGIARALYRNPEILVLDEATSALDNETESAVMQAIDNLQGEKTIIIIAHRLTTIKNADRIFEVKNGKVIERTKKEIGIE